MHALSRRVAEHVRDKQSMTADGEKTVLTRNARAVAPICGARAGRTRQDRSRRNKDTWLEKDTREGANMLKKHAWSGRA
eukprot:9118417-Pyramimonas_sp.AAC.1